MQQAFAQDAIHVPTIHQIGADGSIAMGHYSYVAAFAQIFTFLFQPTIRIGSFSGISANVRFFARQDHHTGWVSNYPRLGFVKDDVDLSRHLPLPGEITIGSDVWIGDSATLMPGVTIGDGAVIGANTVVTKNVEPYRVYVGNPGRVVKQRFSDEVVEKMLRIAWWSWQEKRIRQYRDLIWSPDVTGFLDSVNCRS